MTFFHLLLLLLVLSDVLGAQNEGTNDSDSPRAECLPLADDPSNFACFPDAPPFTHYSNCINTHDDCENWASRGECKNNPGYMLLNCRKVRLPAVFRAWLFSTAAREVDQCLVVRSRATVLEL